MKKITTSLFYSVVTILSLTNCQNKKIVDESKEKIQQTDSIGVQATGKSDDIKNEKTVSTLSFNSYDFAENLKNDNFFESENMDKTIELKDVGIVSYLISDNEATLMGVFYSKETNMAIPYNNRPPRGGAFVIQYFNNNEIKYDEEYKKTYTACLRITLKDPKSIKKLKMYIASESSRVYEYQVDGVGEFKMGFVDLVNVKGIFTGYSAASIYPVKIYEIVNAEIN